MAGAVVVFAALWAVDRAGLLLRLPSDLQRYDGKAFEVVEVVDGDTLEIAAPDGGRPTTAVRLWGVDAPETAKAWAGKEGEPYAAEAMAHVEALAAGRTVRLSLQAHEVRGTYGRLVAYVTLPDGTMLNERLLMTGLAEADERFPHEHMERFELLEKQAKHDAVGMWAEQGG